MRTGVCVVPVVFKQELHTPLMFTPQSEKDTCGLAAIELSSTLTRNQYPHF